MNNSFGDIFRLTTFGESHGKAMGGIIDGIPAGARIDTDMVQKALNRRRPGQSNITTSRREADRVQFLSGLLNNVTLGTPIGFIIENTDQHSADYDPTAHAYRPSHADYTYEAKYGIRDHRGGGRASARETAARVVGGAVAMQILMQRGIRITAYTRSIADIECVSPVCAPSIDLIESNPVRCPDPQAAVLMEQAILSAKKTGDTLGGIVECVIGSAPAGLGDPVFDKLEARLAQAMLSIPAAKGFEYGDGFASTRMKGSESLDRFIVADNGSVTTTTNHSGGIQGGISNGMPIVFRVAFKPVATLLQNVETIDDKGNPTVIHARGRHDPCVVPRAVPIVESMAAMVILDALLKQRTTRL
ncbi:MAG: chorismate synthase [Bacteroides sp.]|nr:chorismate synthase [Bacteroides sp.]MCM1414005.1 chorismate synthase [Bacteroides sp.]MCM1472300.1 chorismate synthase [Bacteroides sp.]